VDTKEEKDKLLSSYKDALNKKECKYFRRGEVNKHSFDLRKRLG
jgi:hypothetical protein